MHICQKILSIPQESISNIGRKIETTTPNQHFFPVPALQITKNVYFLIPRFHFLKVNFG